MTSIGAWCWFSDPRAYYSASKNKTYVGWVSPSGDIMARMIDHGTGVDVTVNVHPNLNQDDHANPSFVETPDGRVYIFYAHHQANDVMYRWTGVDGDIRVMSGVTNMLLPTRNFHVAGAGYSYANPIFVPDGNRMMVFIRQNLANQQQRWVVAINENGMATNSWSGYALWAASTVSGPYLKAMRSGENTIDFVFTTGHPFDIVCDVHYARFTVINGAARYENAAGTQITSVPFGPSQATLVQSGVPVGNTWIWQVDRDDTGAPIVLMSTYPENLTTEHKYRFARWNGAAFITSEICSAGGPLVLSDPPSRYYTGGACFDGVDKNKIHLSRQDTIGWHLETWATDDSGETWNLSGVIDDPLVDGGKYLRPFSPQGKKEVWAFKGPYTTYLNYSGSLSSYPTGDTTQPPPTPKEELLEACVLVGSDPDAQGSVKNLAAKLMAFVNA